MNKKIFNRRSKTHWASAATGFAGAMLTFLPTVMQYIPEELFGPILIGVGVTFHLLRNVTAEDIEAR